MSEDTLYQIIEREGTHLGESRVTPGAFSPLSFDDISNKLVSHIELVPVDAEDLDPSESDARPSRDRLTWMAIGLGLAAVAAGTAVVIGKRKSIAAWWKDKVLPRFGHADDATKLQEMQAEFSQQADVVRVESRASMSSVEAAQRLAALFVAAAFIAEQVRALSTAHIEDLPELNSTLSKLTAESVTAHLNRVLEANTAALDDETAAKLMEVFGGGAVVE
jgi:hypothetical protein